MPELENLCQCLKMNFEGVTYSVRTGWLINLARSGGTYDVELGFRVISIV